MDQNETQWDKLLKIRQPAGMIRTRINTGIRMSRHRIACWRDWLEQRDDRETEYGTGLWDRERARLFYLSYQTRCRSVGIEYDERIFSGAMENREMAVSGARTCFVKADAGRVSGTERS